MTTNKDDIRQGAGHTFVLAEFYSNRMCNNHADAYIAWFCCSHPLKDRYCALLRRLCIVERSGCSTHIYRG